MSTWDSYPPDYRSHQVSLIVSAVQAGECVSVVGLSGSGKSNLLGFLAHRVPLQEGRFVLVDCNRLAEPSPEAFYLLILDALGGERVPEDERRALEVAIDRELAAASRLCLLLDRFDLFDLQGAGPAVRAIAGNLRALRDEQKYALTFVTATRRKLDPHTELAELFFANTLWLGPLSESDARWTVARYASRRSLDWSDAEIEALVRAAGSYPSLLRAACEAHAAGCPLNSQDLLRHPAVQARLEELWADTPGEQELLSSGLEAHPFLKEKTGPPTAGTDAWQLTAKEYRLLEYFRQHAGVVCEKDDLIRAVWPEDKIFERGIRDDSLAQLIRRLREKIEPDPSNPVHIHTLPGRGYRYLRGDESRE